MHLSGIRVVDLSRYLAGPFCAMLLGDFGADVIRVEPPGGADDRKVGPFLQGQSLGVLTFNRNKRSISLNLKDAEGRKLLLRLLRESDVLVENFPPGGLERMGLSPEAMWEVNPGLIVVRVTGFGQSGPLKDWVAFDAVAQAMTGHLALSGREGDDPIKSGMSMVDYATGLYGAFGAMAALYRRKETGRGEVVEVSLYDTAVSFLESALAEAQAGVPRRQMGNRRPATAPTDLFRTRDGWVYISISTDHIWKSLLKVLGREELGREPAYKDNWSRKQHEAELTEMLAQWTAQRSTAEVVAALQGGKIACGPVLDVPDLLQHPHALERGVFQQVDHPGIGTWPLPTAAVRFGGVPQPIRSPAAAPGADNEAVYRDLLGLDPAELEALSRSGVI